MKSFGLIMKIIMHPTYKVILCAETCLPPSPWCDKFTVEVDKSHKVIRISGDFT